MKESTHSSTNVYTIQEILGEGSSGVVYKAEKRDESGQISTTVALKVLNSNEMIDIWRREFHSLKQVRSHNCVQVFGFERVMEKPALSLEYVEGLRLDELVAYGAIESKLIREVTTQILSGLKDLWNQDLFHGDLSPVNVLVSTSGVVKLLDFGLGNRTDNRTLGTPHFVAPEVVTGEIDPQKSDLYSLGRILEYMCVGDGFDPELRQAIQKMTQKAADDRSPPAWESSESNRRALAVLVTRVYRQKKFEQQPTREFVVKSVAFPMQNSGSDEVLQKKKWILAMVVLVATVATLAFLQFSRQKGVAHLKIRSSSWYKLTINGKGYGYTPLDLDNIESGNLQIQWEGPEGRGQRVLTLEAGENKVIDDGFFNTNQGD